MGRKNIMGGKYRQKNFFDFLNENGLVIILTIIAFLGVAVGSVITGCNSNESSPFTLLVSAVIKGTNNQTYLAILLSAIQSVCIVYSVIFLSGISAIGMVTVPILLFFKGLGLGAIIGYFYLNLGYTGFLYCLIMIIPFEWLTLMVFIVFSRESMFLSSVMCDRLFDKSEAKSIFEFFKRFCGRSFVALIFLMLFCVINSFIIKMLGGLFKLNI